MKKTVDIYIHGDIEGIGRKGAEIFLELCLAEVEKKGFFTVVLSGGKTPSALYDALASGGFRDKAPWKDVFVFFGDERCVGPESPRSNFRLAREKLLSRVGVPEENIRRIKAEAGADEAARLYEREIKDFFKVSTVAGRLKAARRPSFDLVFLGLGEDGHTLSLFPGSAALKEKKRLVAPVVGAPGEDRVTMTPGLVNEASSAVFLVSGEGKAGILKEVLEEEGGCPAVKIRPKGRLIWLVDKDAARLIL